MRYRLIMVNYVVRYAKKPELSKAIKKISQNIQFCEGKEETLFTDIVSIVTADITEILKSKVGD